MELEKYSLNKTNKNKNFDTKIEVEKNIDKKYSNVFEQQTDMIAKKSNNNLFKLQSDEAEKFQIAKIYNNVFGQQMDIVEKKSNNNLNTNLFKL